MQMKKGSLAVIGVTCFLLSVTSGLLFGYLDSQAKYQAALQFNFADHYAKPAGFPNFPNGIGPQGWGENYEKIAHRKASE